MPTTAAPTRSAAPPTRWAWCCPSSRWRRCCSRCAPGGEQLGWGFQLQSPVVIAVLALFTLIGLNLAGVFEFGSVLPKAALATLRPGTRCWIRFTHRRARGGGGLALHGR